MRARCRHKRGAAIVYCASRKQCEQVAAVLSSNAVHALHYHAGMKPKPRSEAQQKWQCGALSFLNLTS